MIFHPVFPCGKCLKLAFLTDLYSNFKKIFQNNPYYVRESVFSGGSIFDFNSFVNMDHRL